MSGIEELRVNGSRLWDSLMEVAKIGATPAGGCNRQALTVLDKAGRDLFCQWCRELGCTITVDRMGNIFARREGRDPGSLPVLTGSHLDTQLTGGKFDGVYGVLAGVEVLRTLDEAGISLYAPIELVVWTNEEGARFSPAMLGSGVWSGEFALEQAHAITDTGGCTVKSELESIGYLGARPANARPARAAFELHIEQGPILEAADIPIGIVTGVQGIRWYDLMIHGEACHAGPTPMDRRKDPFMALPPIQTALYSLTAEHAPWARVTFGNIRVEPGSRNTVPERLVLAVDLRHPDPDVLQIMDAAFRKLVDKHASCYSLEADIRLEWDSPPVSFDEQCIEAVREAVRRLDYPAMEMVSGAGHDAVYLSRVVPTAMIFVPCREGISHNEVEYAEPAHLEAGCNVLLHSILACAGSDRAYHAIP